MFFHKRLFAMRSISLTFAELERPKLLMILAHRKCEMVGVVRTLVNIIEPITEDQLEKFKSRRLSSMDAEIFTSISAICALTKFARAESSGTSIIVCFTSSVMESLSPKREEKSKPNVRMRGLIFHQDIYGVMALQLTF